MTENESKCGICGRFLEAAGSDLAGGAWDVATCAGCGRRRVLQDGGVALQLTDPPLPRRFDLGEIQIRPGAVHILAQSEEHYWPYIQRHARGDRGAFHREPDARPRRHFLAGRNNIVSEYRTNLGDRLWVMTTPGKLTAVMAPGEY